jgi:hypothetical protein
VLNYSSTEWPRQDTAANRYRRLSDSDMISTKLVSILKRGHEWRCHELRTYSDIGVVKNANANSIEHALRSRRDEVCAVQSTIKEQLVFPSSRLLTGVFYGSKSTVASAA